MKNDPFTSFNSNKKIDNKCDLIFEYNRKYLKLLSEHSNEISFILNKIKDLRDERLKFFDTDLKNIIQKLKNDDAIDKNNLDIWLNDFVNSMNRSFDDSEILLKTYCCDKIEEFEEKIQNIIEMSQT